MKKRILMYLNLQMKRITLAIILLLVDISFSQDLEPRYLSNIPTQTNAALITYGYSSGNILLNNTIEVDDLDAKINTIGLIYLRSFKLFNKLTKIDGVIPYAFGTYSGVRNSNTVFTHKSGFGDPMVRFSMILIGVVPQDIKEFSNRVDKKFKLGALFRIFIPVGNYDSNDFVNLGTNRWSFKFGAAGSYKIGKRFILETQLNTWIFTENTEFYNGSNLKQNPLLSLQFNATYIFKPGVWAALSFGSRSEGDTALNGVEQNTPQKNTRVGAAFAYRFNKLYSIKFLYTNGISSRYGTDFNTVLLSLQVLWLDKIK